MSKGKYTELMECVKEAVRSGGREICIAAGDRAGVWMLLVKGGSDVYLGFSFGRENAAFLIDLFEYMRIAEIENISLIDMNSDAAGYDIESLSGSGADVIH